MENSGFSTQICSENGFRFEILEKQSQNKNQHPQDLGLNFEKINIEIRINIFKILCVCACVPIFRKNKTALTFSGQICPKMGLGFDIQRTNVLTRIRNLDITCVPIFRQYKQL